MNSNLENLSCQQVKSSQQKSCDGCKAHHIKCDRNVDGCKNCFKRGIACTYLVKSKRRGPKTKVEHFVRYYESLNITSASETPGIFINEGGAKDSNIEGVFYKNGQYTFNTNINMQSSPNFNQLLAPSDSILYQADSNMLPLYQNIYNPTLDFSCYNFPLPLGLNTVVTAPLITPTTIAATNSMSYGLSPVYSSQSQPNINSSPISSQDTCSMYFS